MRIDDLRKEIDAIDQELVLLFCKRMEVSSRIADYKREHNLPVYHPGREKEVLQKVAEPAGSELKEYVQALYKEIFQLSKRYQKKCNAGSDAAEE